MQDQLISTKTKPQSSAARSYSIAGLALPLITLGALWFVLCRHLSGEWSVNEQYSYGWFVPFFALVLFWLRWEDAPSPRLRRREQTAEIRNPQSAIRNNNAALAAAMLAIPALLLLLPLRVFEIGNTDWRPLGWVHTALVVFLTLIYIWYLGGKPWLRHFAFPIAFIFIAVPWISPIEQPIVQGLMRAVAAVAAETLTLFGIPTQLEGSLIRIPSGLVGVNEACSGVRSLQTALMIGLLFGELKRFDLTRRFALIVTAIALSIIANCGRAFFLVWVAASHGIGAVDRWHDFAGYSIVALVFVGTLAAAALLARYQRSEVRSQTPDVRGQRSEVGGQKSEDPPSHSGYGAASSDRSANGAGKTTPFVIRHSSFDIPRPFLVATLLWLIMAELGAGMWYRAHENNLAAGTRWTVHWPMTLPNLRDLKIDEGVRQTLRFDEGRAARWRAEFSLPGETEARSNVPNASSYTLFFFRWNPGSGTVLRARAHRPDICLPSTGWEQTAEHPIRRYDIGSNLALPFQHFEFVRKRRGPFERDQFVHAFFCLQEDNLRQTEPRPDLNVSDGSQPDWSFWGRTRVVLNGVRNLGQQTMELVLMSPVQISSNEAEERFSHLVRDLIVVDAQSK